TAAADGENVRRFGISDTQRDVGPRFLNQSLANVARGHELAVNTGERAVIDGEFHLDGRRIDRHERQWFALDTVGNRFADEDFLEAGQPDDVARVSFSNLNAFHPFEMINRG